MFAPRARFPLASRRFGRRAPFVHGDVAAVAAPSLGNDVRLFATTFIGGLVFMTVYLA